MSIPAWILIGIVILLAGANSYILWRRRPSKIIEPIYHFQCPGCRRKLKYRARQVGNQGMCPQCRQRWVFPPVPETELKH